MSSEDFPKRLKATRIASGFESARSFAEELGIGEDRYSAWERGPNEPNMEMLVKIQKITGVSLDTLIVGTRPVIVFERADTQKQNNHAGKRDV